MLDILKHGLIVADSGIASALLRLRGDQPGLVTLLFHSLFFNQSEVESGVVDPLDAVTVDQFRSSLQHFQQAGYRFVSAKDVVDGIDGTDRCAMVTFDDGYHNNLRALPILKELQIPGLFFVSSGHIRTGQSFWWDVFYRERLQQGLTPKQMKDEQEAWKSLTHDQIQQRLIAEFGEQSLRPKGDLDRPMTPDELAAFAREELVTVGNHTCNHAVLTNYSCDGIYQQLQTCQNDLADMIGYIPSAVSYPDGRYSDAVLSVAEEMGFRVGMTTKPTRCTTALPSRRFRDALTIGRFNLLGTRSISRQCQLFRSEFSVTRSLQSLLG